MRTIGYGDRPHYRAVSRPIRDYNREAVSKVKEKIQTRRKHKHDIEQLAKKV